MSGRLSQAAQQRMGLPEGFKPFSAFPFKGLNQSASRIAMEDSEFWWQENFIKIGEGNLRTLWDAGLAFYTAPAGKTIVSFFFFNIGPQEYVAVFLSDGTAVQVSWPNAVQTPLGSGFYRTGGSLPALCQSGTQFLIIANNNTQNDYWIWDGTLLYPAGSIAPFTSDELTSGGAGYTSLPTPVVFGGSGTGVVVEPVIAEGSVVSLTVVNPGIDYLPGDIVQVAFLGGGSDDGAVLGATISGGAIESVTLVDGGTGFSGGPFALTFTGGGGTGATGTYTIANGTVASIDLVTPGSGYTSTPNITFTSGGGAGAAAVAALNPGTVDGIFIVSGGTNFSGTPLITITGGGGIGATAVADMSNGVIVGVTVTNGGSGYQSVPAVEVQPGVNNAAQAILNLMPFGVSGSAIETYQSRVWISFPFQQGTESNGGVFNVSATGSLTDFATSDGGDIFTNSDRFLRQQYTFIRQTSNFLYFVGDSSTSVVSNVQTSDTPISTTFSYQNTDPQIGSSWRDTAQDFSNTILFANALGVYGIYGGSVRKLSKKVDNLFTNAVPPSKGGLIPTSAVANIYSQKVYLLLLTITDPDTRTARNVMLGWDETEWFIASQAPALNYIGTQEVNSDLQAWGTDGASLYPLFAKASPTLVKSIRTKQWDGQRSMMIKVAHSAYIDAVDNSSGQAGIAFNGSIDAVGLAVPVINSVTQALQSCPSGSWPFPQTLNMVAPQQYGAMYGFGVGAGLPQVPGTALGITLASSSPDFTLRNISLGVLEMTAVA